MPRILGVDPGLRHCGVGIVDCEGSHLRYVFSTTIRPKTTDTLAQRLLMLSRELAVIIAQFSPDEAALEETFVSVNGQSTLKLGQARGAILLTLGQGDLTVSEYAARLVKKSITGNGAADKDQMMQMIKLLLPQSNAQSEDEADALGIAITHAHHRSQILA